MTGAVPLPEYLTDGSCGCAYASMGSHLTSCVPAKEYDSTPLEDRPGYVWTNEEDGDGHSNSFASISWRFPLTLQTDVRFEVNLDPAAYFQHRLKDYRSWEQEDLGYEAWEKPMAYLFSLIEDGLELSLPYAGRQVLRESWSMDMVDDSPRWTPLDTLALHLHLFGVCPSCGGLGIRPTGFDDADHDSHEQCTSCHGTGVSHVDPNQMTLDEALDG